MNTNAEVLGIEDYARFRLVLEARSLVCDFIMLKKREGVKPDVSVYETKPEITPEGVTDRDEPTMTLQGWPSPSADIIFDDGRIFYDAGSDKAPCVELADLQLPIDYLVSVVEGLRKELGIEY